MLLRFSHILRSPTIDNIAYIIYGPSLLYAANIHLFLVLVMSRSFTLSTSVINTLLTVRLYVRITMLCFYHLSSTHCKLYHRVWCIYHPSIVSITYLSCDVICIIAWVYVQVYSGTLLILYQPMTHICVMSSHKPL